MRRRRDKETLGCHRGPWVALDHDVARLDPQEYQRRAEECLQKVARWLEDIDPDEVDYSTGDGKLQIEFPDGIKFVLNRQGAAGQMWFAAIDRAWHFDWNAAAQVWIDDKDGHDLYARVAEAVSKKLGHHVTL